VGEGVVSHLVLNWSWENSPLKISYFVM
jgi:hypothetical protein